jgi:hypothetical protein
MVIKMQNHLQERRSTGSTIELVHEKGGQRVRRSRSTLTTLEQSKDRQALTPLTPSQKGGQNGGQKSKSMGQTVEILQIGGKAILGVTYWTGVSTIPTLAAE